MVYRLSRSHRRLWPLLAVTLMIGIAAGAGLAVTFAGSSRHPYTTSAALRGGASRAQRQRWIASWTASTQAPAPGSRPAYGFRDRTIRSIIFPSVGGPTARVRFANTFGSRSLKIGRAAVGVVGRGAAIAAATNTPLTFGGRPWVVVRAGGEALSDPVRLAVRPLEPLAVSVFLPNSTGIPTEHPGANQVNYLAAGNHALDSKATSFTAWTGSWYFVSGLDVPESSRELGAVVALGDSITNGDGSRWDANARWPNALARRFAALRGVSLSVVDAGLGGNRLLNDAPCCGASALARFSRDVLDQPGVAEVIVLEGINDIGYSTSVDPLTAPHTDVSAKQLIAGYQRLVTRAHAAGLKVFGATLTPFKGARRWTRTGEAKRETINTWIRTSRAFDGVIDFAAALANPGEPEKLNPAYDSGDHLHPNDAGYQAMANAISLATLLDAAHRP